MNNSNNELEVKNGAQDKNVENRAVISMVLGIASIVGCLFAGPIALACGIVAMVMASKVQKNLDVNNGFAKAGFITGLVGTILTTLILIFTILLLVVGKNVFNKYSDGSLNNFIDRLFDVVEKSEKYEKIQEEKNAQEDEEQSEKSSDLDNKREDNKSIQEDSKLEDKKEKLDELKKEISDLKDEILTTKNNGDVTKIAELQQKIVELTDKIIELESEILELED